MGGEAGFSRGGIGQNPAITGTRDFAGWIGAGPALGPWPQ
jgi:NADPH-dependent glutamate synthase beta subunit-like oxidoreductase